MKYALAIAANKEDFTAAYVSIYSFNKHNKAEDILLYGNEPDVVLEHLNAAYVELGNTSKTAKLPPTRYLNDTCIVFKDNYDAYVIADTSILYTKNIEDYIQYAIDSKRVLGSTKIVDDKLALDTSIYIVPSNVICNKITSTVLSGINRKVPETMLIDAYYPVLDDSLSYDILTVNNDTVVYNTDKAIVYYDKLAWQNTVEGDLWTKYGEELIEELSK